MSQFSTLGLAAPIARAIEAKGYASATPIQLKAIPAVLAGGDVLGIAATGTGKTAAFALPVLHRLHSDQTKANRPGACRALVLCPTRELAAQIASSFKTYGAHTRLRVSAIYGGVSFDKQMKELKRGADIIVATPGRLLDHMARRTLQLDQVKMIVLDEADHMLDLGFIPAVRRIVKALPLDRQTLMFSATMPPAIRSLADEMLTAPTTISVTPSARPPEIIEQSVVFIDANAKRRHLANLLAEHGSRRSLVFTRTKRAADRVVKDLIAARLAAAAIHGNKSQSQRERALDAFRSAKTPVLVATDIAARGIDIGGIDLVINFDLPEVPETYVHRIGRTARAGAGGRAVSFCADHERPLLKAIERSIGKPVPRSEVTGAKDGVPRRAGAA
ncbi:MAG TPA: DEAD/DEAH box helicase [Alphaproteobacteria bacterium]|nr:DEAD/DEAH box helicase [Alphaproteobacteria bacterium]